MMPKESYSAHFVVLPTLGEQLGVFLLVISGAVFVLGFIVILIEFAIVREEVHKHWAAFLWFFRMFVSEEFL